MKNKGLFQSTRLRRRLAICLFMVLLAGILATDLPRRGEISVIQFYKGWISPVSSTFTTCRFQPT